MSDESDSIFEIEGADAKRPPKASEREEPAGEVVPETPADVGEFIQFRGDELAEEAGAETGSETGQARRRTSAARPILKSFLPVLPKKTDLSPNRGWAYVPLILFAIGTISVAFSQKSVGLAWDEAYYYTPSKLAAEWTSRMLSGERLADPESIDQYWAEIHEHPSYFKFVAGLSLLFFEDILGPIRALRLPNAFMFGFSLSLLFLLGRIAWGRVGGLVAAISYLAMPRIFGHAHFGSLETPLVFSSLLLTYCFLRGLTSPSAAVMTGLSLGLLLATKINGFFMIPPLILWAHLFHRGRYVNNLFSMLVLGPITFVALWPWLWHDTILRGLEYLAFHTVHQKTALWFLGQKWGYGELNSPSYYPSVMIAVTVPISVLGLAALGIVETFTGLRKRGVALLFVMIGLINWAVASAPSTPRYDGVRLFVPLFPYIALMAGAGGHAIMKIARVMGQHQDKPGRELIPMRISFWGVVAIVLAEGTFAMVRYHPFELSYFNPLAGGLKGAAARGFETTYWGEAVNADVLAVLNRHDLLPPGSRIKVLALHEKNFQLLQAWGLLRNDIHFGGSPPYDAHLLLHRRGFHGRPERALGETQLFIRLGSWTGPGGVELLSLHRTGKEFEQYWPRHGDPPGRR